jgi:hypothetical protein
MTKNKPYIRPVVSKIEVDEQIIRMFTREGFTEVFWEELLQQRKTNPKISEKAVFDSLNQKFYNVFREFRYSSYDSFKHIK